LRAAVAQPAPKRKAAKLSLKTTRADQPRNVKRNSSDPQRQRIIVGRGRPRRRN
jgi:hypothetical protein